jgi:uncharacterized protein YndB with AHSA1/START domain
MTAHSRASTNASPDGTIARGPDGNTLRFERHLAHPVERVWAALTEPDELVKWLAEARIDLVPGGTIELRWLNTDAEGNQPVLHGTITRLEAPTVIEYDGDIHGLLRWEVHPEGDGSRLTFTAFTPATGEDAIEALAGWHIHLDHFTGALDGDRVDWTRWHKEHYPTWSDLRDRYAVRISS